MKKLILIAAVFAVSGCAMSPSLQELTEEAHQCVARQHDDAGVLTKATSEQSGICWSAVNKKVDSIAKRELELEEEAAGRCGKGLVNWCAGGRCGCITTYDARQRLCDYGYC